jgi:lipoate-protein ligase A
VPGTSLGPKHPPVKQPAAARRQLARTVKLAAVCDVLYLDLTCASPEANLACDEALLDVCDAAEDGPGVLRLWEPSQHFVVVGYGGRVAQEVNLAACTSCGIPVLRRCSGGGTVLQGPGCLNYSLVLPVRADPCLASIAQTNQFVLERHRQVLSHLLAKSVALQSQTDLAIDSLKCSGNAQRRRSRAVLVHGTFLLGLDLDLMEAVLPLPARQPAYRQGRQHREFLTQLPLSAHVLKAALRQAWAAERPLEQVPWQAIDALVQRRYSQPAWTFRF